MKVSFLMLVVSGFLSINAFASCPVYRDEVDLAITEVQANIRSIDGSITGVQAGIREIATGNRSGTVSDSRRDAATTARDLNSELAGLRNDRAEFVTEQARLQRCLASARPRPPSVARPTNPPREYMALSDCDEQGAVWSARCDNRTTHSLRLSVARDFTVGAGEQTICFINGNVRDNAQCNAATTANSNEMGEPLNVCTLNLKSQAMNQHGAVRFGTNGTLPIEMSVNTTGPGNILTGNASVQSFDCRRIGRVRSNQYCAGTPEEQYLVRYTHGAYIDTNHEAVRATCGSTDYNLRNDPRGAALLQEREQLQHTLTAQRRVLNQWVCSEGLREADCSRNAECSTSAYLDLSRIGDAYSIPIYNDSRALRLERKEAARATACVARISANRDFISRKRTFDDALVAYRNRAQEINAQFSARLAEIENCTALHTTNIQCYGPQSTPATRAQMLAAMGPYLNAQVETTIPFDVQADRQHVNPESRPRNNDDSSFENAEEHASHTKKRAGRGIASQRKAKH